KSDAPLAPRSSRVGLARTSVMPKAVSDGPIPRTATFLGAFPVIINPAISTLSPVSTRSRVEMFSANAGEGVGVGVSVGVGAGVVTGGVGVGVAGVRDGVGVGVAGVTEGVGVGVGVPDGVGVAVGVKVGLGDGVEVGVGVGQPVFVMIVKLHPPAIAPDSP